MTPLESKLYVALLACRPVIAATANVNPAALKIKTRVDSALAAYKAQSDRETPEDTEEQDAHAAGN
jgi:hypothetical protein